MQINAVPSVHMRLVASCACIYTADSSLYSEIHAICNVHTANSYIHT